MNDAKRAKFLEMIRNRDQEAIYRSVKLSNLRRMGYKLNQPAIFLDRDGVINDNRGFVNTPEDFRLLPGVGDALKKLQSKFKLCVVTNQGGIGLGHLSEQSLERIHRKMHLLLDMYGVKLTGVEYASQAPNPNGEGAASRRKPGTGMFWKLVERYRIDPEKSYMVGDRESDITAGLRMGCTTYFIGPDDKPDGGAHFRMKDLSEVANHILANMK